MSIVELGDCSRLCARISLEQCKKNRRNGTFACTDCVGLNNVKATEYKPVEHDPEPILPEPLPAAITINQTISEPEEETIMSKSTHGDCPLCKRKNVHMPGPKCSRCYSRLKKGLDVITGLPVLSQKAKTVAKPVPPPSCDKPALEIRSKPIAFTRGAHYIDPIACLDAAWEHQRTTLTRQLANAPSDLERFAIASRMMTILSRLEAGGE